MSRRSLISVFLSSTFQNLIEERDRITKALTQLYGLHFIGMEDFGSRTSAPAQVSLDRVDDADLYVGVVGNRYGSGITEQEYERAKKSGLPRLVYFYKPAAGEFEPIDESSSRSKDADALRSFKARLGQELTIATVTSMDELTTAVLAGVS